MRLLTALLLAATVQAAPHRWTAWDTLDRMGFQILALGGGFSTGGGGGGPTLVCSTAQGSGTGNQFTTTGINCTGATFLYLTISSNEAAPGLTSNITGAWTSLTQQGNLQQSEYLYNPNGNNCASGCTAVTFTVGTQASADPSVCVMGFSGVTSAIDGAAVGSGSSTNGTSVQPGSVTPSITGELATSGIEFYNTTGTVAVDSSFTIPASGQINGVGSQHLACAAAYLVTPSTSALNPIWTHSGGGNISTFDGQWGTNALFK